MIGQPVIDISGFFKTLQLGPLILPVYFLVPSLAFIVCLFWLVKRVDARRLKRNTALDLAIVFMSTGFIFARLFHVFFEEPAYYLEDFSRVLDVWSGGFVWYGGVVFGTLSGVLLMRWRKEPIARWLDLFAPIGALGYALGRFACLFVGCCYGKTFVWNEHIIRHPTQLYSIVLELLALAYLLRVEKSGRLREGELILRWVIIHGINRLVIEQFRGDPRGPELLGLSIATWISSALILSAGAVTFLGYRPEKKRPA